MVQMRKGTLFVLLLILSMALGAWGKAAIPGEQIKGKLRPELAVSGRYYVETIEAVPDKDIITLGLMIPAGAAVYRTAWKVLKDFELRILLVEPLAGEPFVYADLNADGRWTEAERRDFKPLPKESSGFDREASFELPLHGAAFHSLPISIRHPRGKIDPKNASIARSAGVAALGSAVIDGRPTLVRCDAVQVKTGEIDVQHGWMGVDSNQDGRIDTGIYSFEYAFADGEAPVFRAGSKFVSTERMDVAKGQIVLNVHKSSEYDRIELRLGAAIADFSFSDFEGRPRKLSEFRGGYLLLDFWGTWCKPCLAEIPNLLKAYGDFHGRGLNILGLDNESIDAAKATPDEFKNALEKAKALIKQKGVPWPQVSPESFHKSLEKRFRIAAYPTFILLDSRGKIVSFGDEGQLPVRGVNLLKTLEELLPKKR
jgi:thiol-disulfide isomerase/thioredoxin